MVHIHELPPELFHIIFEFLAYPDPLRPRAPRAKPQDENTVIVQADDDDDWTDDDDDDDDDGDDDDDDEDLKDDEHVPDQVDDLLSACLVSRRFRDMAQPFIFQHFWEDNIDGNLSTTVSFAKALCTRPDLGKHVKYMTFSAGPVPISDSPVLNDKDLAFFEGVVKNLKLAQREEAWIRGLKTSDIGMWAALLLNKTPNLLDLDLPAGQFSLWPITEILNRNPSLLSQLENVGFECDDDYHGYNIGEYERFLTFPKLKSVMFEHGDLDDASFPSSWAPGSLNLTDVMFENCFVDAGAIKKFMQACKKMKSFSYENFNLDPEDGRALDDSDVKEFNAVEIQDAVRLHKDTLEHFRLDFSRDLWAMDSPESIQQYNASHVKLGSFREFSVLQTIVLPHAVLQPHPKFSHSIKTLVITDCNCSIRDMVEKIAKDCKNGHYPDLVHFKVMALDITRPIKLPGQIIPEGQTPEQCFRSLQDNFKGTKVDFQIIPYEPPDFDDDLDDDGLDPYDDDPYEFNFHSDDEDEDDDGEFNFAEPPRPSQMPGLFDMVMQHAMLNDPDFGPILSRGGGFAGRGGRGGRGGAGGRGRGRGRGGRG